MTTVRQRLGNVLAWVGFACFLFGVVPMVVIAAGYIWETKIQEQPSAVTNVSCNYLLDASEQDSDAAKSIATIEKHGLDLERCGTEGVDRVGIAIYDGEDYYFYLKSYQSTDDYIKQRLAWQDVGYSYRNWKKLFKKFADGLFFTAAAWLLSLILNYIFFGSARFLPWKKG